MPKAWSKKDERQYKAIVKKCLEKDARKTKRCKSMAAAIVNKRRSAEGRTKKSRASGRQPNWFQKALVEQGFFIISRKVPPFRPKAMGLRRASKAECLYKSGKWKGRPKNGCIWGWGPKYKGKLFKAKSRAK